REPFVDVESPADLAEEPIAALVDVPWGVAVDESRVEEDVDPELDERRPVLVEVELPVERDREADPGPVVPAAAVVIPARPVEIDAEVDVDGVVDRRNEAVVQDRDAEARAGRGAPSPPRQPPVDVELKRPLPAVRRADVDRARLRVHDLRRLERREDGERRREPEELGTLHGTSFLSGRGSHIARELDSSFYNFCPRAPFQPRSIGASQRPASTGSALTAANTPPIIAPITPTVATSLPLKKRSFTGARGRSQRLVNRSGVGSMP